MLKKKKFSSFDIDVGCKSSSKL